MDFLNKIICGDSLDVLKQMSSESIDLMVTDPPYGYSFMGKDWDKVVMPVSYWKECLRVLKDGSFAFIMSAPRQDVLSVAINNLKQVGFNVGFTSIYWAYASGFPKASNVGKMVDAKIRKGNASPSGVNKSELSKDNGFVKTVVQPNCGILGEKRKVTKRIGGELVTPQAKSFDGSYAGFQPKPAVEIIIVAMKPLSEKTYTDQALKNRKGITWLDDCRMPCSPEIDTCQDRKMTQRSDSKEKGWGMKPQGEIQVLDINKGRFPANLLVSDDILDDGKERKAGDYKGEGSKSGGIWQESTGEPAGREYGDSGSFSRYFDLDKWAAKTFPFLIVPKASKSEKNKGMKELNRPIGNNHPTVKPIKLFAYLITLGSRERDVILDPFLGSGTSVLSCLNLNRQFVGIEINPEYCEIAKKRLINSSINQELFK